MKWYLLHTPPQAPSCFLPLAPKPKRSTYLHLLSWPLILVILWLGIHSCTSPHFITNFQQKFFQILAVYSHCSPCFTAPVGSPYVGMLSCTPLRVHICLRQASIVGHCLWACLQAELHNSAMSCFQMFLLLTAHQGGYLCSVCFFRLGDGLPCAGYIVDRLLTDIATMIKLK